MPRARRNVGVHSKKLALAAGAASIVLHGGLLLFMLLRPEPPPRLVIAVGGPGEGVVRAKPGELRCTEHCSSRYEVGTEVEISASAGEGSTFAGWPEHCHRGDSPLSCRLVIEEDTLIEVRFGRPPEDVQVAWLDVDHLPPSHQPPIDLDLPTFDDDAESPDTAPERRLDHQAPEETPEETPEEIVEEIVEVEEVEPRDEPEQPDRSNLKAVEVPDENVVDEAPDDAQYLSDKHRHVEEQTRATETNLERQQEGEAPHSEESDLEGETVGGPEDVIAHLETSEPTALEPEQVPESPRAGEDERAAGIEPGKEGEDGDEADEGGREPGMLSMRDPELGAHLGPEPAGDRERDDAGGAPGAPGVQELDLRLSFEDYERIVGEERLREVRELGRRQTSQRRGRWERRQEALRASLENFTPEVRPGNQTALSTRAEPFAVYIARMHRRIHELWGFGFLEELSRKSPGHELNDRSLHTKLEIVIDPDGQVAQTTIVKPSGVLAFDVAAIDAVQTAGPYERPPSAIRSANGKVYIHWSFHRNHRQCGTFGAHPFILDNPPDDADRSVDDADVLERLPRRASARAGGGGGPGASPRGGRRGPKPPDPDDPRAERAATRWLGALDRGDAAAMAEASALPFRSGGRVVAQSRGELSRIYETVLREADALAPRRATILTAAGHRRQIGPLPAGVRAATQRLFLVVRLPGEQLILVLGAQGDGEFSVIGLER